MKLWYNLDGDPMEYNLEKIIEELDFEKNMHRQIHQMWLTNLQIEVLKKNHISYEKYFTMNELLYHIHEKLEITDNPELEKIAIEIAETNYYMNTKK